MIYECPHKRQISRSNNSEKKQIYQSEEAGIIVSTVAPVPHFDKVVHCGIFAGFVILWAAGMRKLGKKHPLVYMAQVILIAVLLGLAIEFLQKELVDIHRDFDWWDWVADCIGAFLGGAIFRELYRKKKETS